jgi:pyruvate ferredoxin oxidoreductase alpha subunit
MSNIQALTGDSSVANAMRQINPDVLAAYPITPQTEIVQDFASFVSDGLVDTEMITVESEHSAMSACVGASASGARVMTATSANGLALMWEIVYIAASMRLPIVMPVVNRALSGPLNIHCDHSDCMGARDSGWIQVHSENAQEAYDNTIQAVRIGEQEKVRLPVMVNLDGFILSHGMERVELLDDAEVTKFIGELKTQYPLLDVDHPVTYGPLDLYDYYFEHKRQQVEAMENVLEVITSVGEEFGKLTGRKYSIMEKYKLDDAEVAAVALGSTNGTAQAAVDELRKEGIKAGLLKLRVFRPFPAKEIVEALSNAKHVAIFDRSISFGGFGGPLFTEIRSAFLGNDKIPATANYIYGLGGRDINVSDIKTVYKNVASGKSETVNYVSVRE